MLTRADSFTSVKKKQEYFSDFLDNFDKTPVGDQLARSTNEQSINRSLIHLIKTNLDERLFQPEIGSNVIASLFDNNSIILIHNLEFYIQNTINNNEPRVSLVSVKVESASNQRLISNPTLSDENTLEVTIVYYIINNPEPVTLNFILKRIR